MINVAVAGSRKFKDKKFVIAILEEFRKIVGNFHVISGGAEGPDIWAATWASDSKMSIPTVHPARWDDIDRPGAVIRYHKNNQPYDAAAGIYRNQFVINDADVLLAFMDVNNPTPGTSDAIERARKKGIPVIIAYPPNIIF